MAKDNHRTFQDIFVYEGTNKTGQRVQGELPATNLNMAKAALRQQGIVPIKVKKRTTSIFKKKKKKITPLDVMVFSRQMSTMMTAGIPLIQSFDIVGRGHTNKSMQELILNIKTDVESGNTLSEALGKHPQYFNELYCNLVAAGEQSGSLEIMLNRIAMYQEKTESIKKKIKKAMMYPIAILTVAFIVSTILLVKVVPQFASLFKGFGAELPAPTLFVINLSNFFKAYWWVMVSVVVGSVWSFKNAIRRSKKFAIAFDKFLLRIPIMGTILYNAAIARFARTLSITFSAGLPLIEALLAVSGATGNLIYTKGTLDIRQSVSTGQQLQTSMNNTGLFPNMVIQMVAIGEESGALEEMLGKIADYYEEMVDNAVDTLSTLMEPFILVFLAVIVGGLVVSMYMPIFKLGSVV